MIFMNFKNLTMSFGLQEIFDDVNINIKEKENDFEARQIEVFAEMAKKGLIFKGLKPYTNVVYPWREEYRELMKDWVLEDVQYNYGIFGSE